MENNNEMTVPAEKASGPDTEKKRPGFYLTRPSDWPRLDMKFIKNKCGMLNDTEFKLVILTCKTGADAVKTVETLRDVLKNIGSYANFLSDEQIKNNDNLYLIIRKLIIELNAARTQESWIRDNPAHINETHCDCCDHDMSEESEQPSEEDNIKSEEEIEQEAEDYEEYEKAYDENARNNARPSVKKSERYK